MSDSIEKNKYLQSIQNNNNNFEKENNAATNSNISKISAD